MAILIIRPKTREEWLEMRKTGIGSSEIVTAAGLNPFESRYELWERKMGLIEPKQENEDIMLGHELEDTVAQIFQRKSGKKIIKASKIDWQFKDAAHPWRLASPDRTYWISDDNHNVNDWSAKGILECKTTNRRDITPDNIPLYWQGQVQWQMGNSPAIREAHVGWLCKFGCTLDFARLDYNEDVFNMLCEIGDEFWLKNIKEGIAPVEMNAADIKRVYHKDNGQSVMADNDIVRVVNRYHELKDKIDPLNSELEELRDKVIVAIGANSELRTPEGVILATYKAPAPSLTLDQTAMKEQAPELWKRFATKKQGARRLLIK